MKQLPKVGMKRKITPKPPTSTQEEIVCTMCDTRKKLSDFYQSYDPLNKTGRYTICKQCIKSYSCRNGFVNVDNLKEILKRMDRPFLASLYKKSLEDNMDSVGTYMKNIAMPQTRDLRWNDSEFASEEEDDFEEDDKIVHKHEFNGRWIGNKHIDAVHMENFYQNMKRDNRIETAQDEVYLCKLAMMNLEMDLAAKKGEWDKFKKISDTFSRFMGDAKLRTMDKTQSDLTGGIKSFGNIFAEVEKDDFIPPWKEYAKINGAKPDIIDKTIMHILNFTLKLNRVNRMIEPPEDCPKPESWEIDEDATYTDVAVSLTQDDTSATEGD